MKIDLTKITVRDLVEDYHDDGEGGVRGRALSVWSNKPGTASDKQGEGGKRRAARLHRQDCSRAWLWGLNSAI